MASAMAPVLHANYYHFRNSVLPFETMDNLSQPGIFLVLLQN
jgi:hypothetical protein